MIIDDRLEKWKICSLSMPENIKLKEKYLNGQIDKERQKKDRQDDDNTSKERYSTR